MIEIRSFLKQVEFRDTWGFEITRLEYARDLDRIIDALKNEFSKIYNPEVLRFKNKIIIQCSRKTGE